MPSGIPVPGGIHFFALLPRKHQQQFLAECREVELVFGDSLSEERDRIRHGYLPTCDSAISLITRVEGNPDFEVGMVVWKYDVSNHSDITPEVTVSAALARGVMELRLQARGERQIAFT